MTSHSIYYVYYLIDPRNNQPFYIGKGSGERLYAHVYEAKGPEAKWKNRLKCQRINSIIKSGQSVKYEKVAEEMLESEAYNLEAALITEHGCLMDGSGTLTNIKKADLTNINSKVAVDQYTTDGEFIQTFQSMIEAATTVGVTPKLIGLACSGKQHTSGGYCWSRTEEGFRLLKPHDDIHGIKYKTVMQLSTIGEVIACFKSLKEAEKCTGVLVANISKCCIDPRRKTAGGFIWQFN